MKQSPLSNRSYQLRKWFAFLLVLPGVTFLTGTEVQENKRIKNFYRLLKVDHTSHTDVIRVAFEKKIEDLEDLLKYEKDPNSPLAIKVQAKMKAVEEAYATLSDSLLRALYDQFLQSEITSWAKYQKLAFSSDELVKSLANEKVAHAKGKTILQDYYDVNPQYLTDLLCYMRENKIIKNLSKADRFVFNNLLSQVHLGKTLFYQALEAGLLELVSLLVKLKVDVNQKPTEGRIAMEVLLEKQNEALQAYQDEASRKKVKAQYNAIITLMIPYLDKINQDCLIRMTGGAKSPWRELVNQYIWEQRSRWIVSGLLLLVALGFFWKMFTD